MSYYFATSVPLPFDEAVGAAEAALAGEGFGIISRIDIQATLQTKIEPISGRTPPRRMHPKLAYKALQSEDEVGTMLPCNLVVDVCSGQTEVAAIDLSPPCRRSRTTGWRLRRARFEPACCGG